MARNVYEVAPAGDRWTVRKTRGTAPDYSSTHATKEFAVETGRAVALGHQPSQLIIKKRDGTIETEHTYGKDPFPPRG